MMIVFQNNEFSIYKKHQNNLAGEITMYDMRF